MGVSGGVHGFLQSLAGMGVGFICFGFFFALRWFGAGDVKLLMAFGAWGGPRYGFEVALLSVILGGVLAIIFLIVTGRVFDFGKRFYHFIRSILIRELAYEPFQADRRLRLPFAIPLAMAAIAQALSNPLQQLGLNWLEVWHG